MSFESHQFINFLCISASISSFLLNLVEPILDIIKGLPYCEPCTLWSKRIIINILYNILFILTLIGFKATVLLHTLISFKVFLAEAAKHLVVAPDMAARELIGLIEGAGAANLI